MNNSSEQSLPPGPDVYTDGRCLKVGVLTNPRSGGNKKGLGEIFAVLAQWPDALHIQAVDPNSINKALSEFSLNGVELVVVNGGDGTVHAVLTALGRDNIFTTPPLLALLCAGTTSMLPRDVGSTGPSAAALSRILQWAKSTNTSLTVFPRSILQVKRASDEPVLFGMFFGAGAICQGIKAFHSGVNPMGWRGELMPGLTLLRMLLAILRKDQDTVPPLSTKTRIDGHLKQERANLFVLVSTLDRLFLGMRPYWGEEGGPLRYTAVAARPKYLLRILPSMFRVKKSHHISPKNGYFSHNAHELQLEIKGDFTLDGELYDTGEGPISIKSAGPVMFVR